MLLAWTAFLSNDGEVQLRIESALARDPDLLDPILLGISEHSEQHDRSAVGGPPDIDVHIETVPAWFPRSAVVAEIRRRYPDLQPTQMTPNLRRARTGALAVSPPTSCTSSPTPPDGNAAQSMPDRHRTVSRTVYDGPLPASTR
ncbi:hypothetical protein GCM10009557_00790 [Virgisporangium ochraceum]|uniref:Uncharacterized protein n=1 Tax=Virgisporangium ochraceum TaxID=65505 RepID=A0A8J4EGV9_9ACTN|nr:hypothetical protein Voc01_090280 [Virgisporangium ochraceum]